MFFNEIPVADFPDLLIFLYQLDKEIVGVFGLVNVVYV